MDLVIYKPPSLTKIENDIVSAGKEKQIKDYSSNDLAEELKNTMPMVFSLIGYKPQQSDGILFANLVMLLMRHYGGLSLKDFRLAFELAVVGDLDLKSDDLKHYNNVTPQYVFQILNAYLKKKQSTIQRMPTTKIINKQPSDAEKKASHEYWRNQIIMAFLALKYTDKYIFDAFAIANKFVYKWLDNIGYIEPSEPNKDDKQMAYHTLTAKAINKITPYIVLQAIRQNGRENNKDLINTAIVFMEHRQIINGLREFIKDEENIFEYIKNF